MIPHILIQIYSGMKLNTKEHVGDEHKLAQVSDTVPVFEPTLSSMTQIVMLPILVQYFDRDCPC